MAEAVRPGQRASVAVAARDGQDAITAAARFSVLVDRHHAALLRYLCRQTGDPEVAADLAQETFLAAFRHRGQLADEGAFAAWLFGIARNQLRMEWRRRKLRRLMSLDWLTANGSTAPTLQHPDASAGCQERDEIQRALDVLSQTLREALLLHSLCGFTGGEVAQILGVTPAAARKRIVRAEQAFRSALEFGAPARRTDSDATQ